MPASGLPKDERSCVLWRLGRRRSVFPDRDPRPLYFLHLSKTAGTTLRHWWVARVGEKNVMDTYVDRCPPDLNALWRKRHPPRLIVGHNDWSLIERLKWEVRVITLLRDPLAQVVSHYAYLKRGIYAEHREIVRAHTTIAEFARAHAFGHNLQTQQLAGLADDLPLRDEPQKWLAVAKANLDACFWFGIAEQLDVSVSRLSQQLEWPFDPQERLPLRNKGQGPRPSLSETDRVAILDSNRLDVELYRYACQRLGLQPTSPTQDARP